ncbi:MAG: hypothetical protein LBG20_02600 [Holosporaceae bacterium]|nr:hypothetical protein [Holosporaceae bacterium]
MEFCAHCAVNMFQNNGRRITRRDFTDISCAAFLPFWGGGTGQYGAQNNSASYILGFFGQMSLCCVVGTAANRAKIKWIMANNWGAPPPSRGIHLTVAGTTSNHISIINRRCSVNVEYDTNFIYPGLQIAAGEIKMIVEICLHNCHNTAAGHAKKLGFLVLTPKATTTNGYFGTAVAFTPKPGLFNETAP